MMLAYTNSPSQQGYERNDWLDGYKSYFKGGKFFKNRSNSNQTLYRILDLVSSDELWKLKCSIEVGEHRRIGDKNNKKE